MLLLSFPSRWSPIFDIQYVVLRIVCGSSLSRPPPAAVFKLGWVMSATGCVRPREFGVLDVESIQVRKSMDVIVREGVN